MSPPVIENSCTSPPAQENMITAHCHEDINFDSLNYYPDSKMANKELSVMFDLDNDDAV